MVGRAKIFGIEAAKPLRQRIRRRLARGPAGTLWRAAKRALVPTLATPMVELTPRTQTLLPMLACTRCRGPLRPDDSALVCSNCGTKYPIIAGRPVFSREDGFSPRIMPVEHMSNQPPRGFLDWMAGLDGWALNIGAGATQTKLDNVVEVEYAVFRHTDVVTDAHHLPFPDAAFDAVVSFNTFEHLSDPNRAASEIFRVLKPGGRLVIHTAFLQPLHEPPHHYYNTTEFGLRRWFAGFDIAEVTVSDNFQPAHVLAWLSSELLAAIGAAEGAEARANLASSTLQTWAAGWDDPSRRAENPLWQLLARLPQNQQKRWAAGFQLDARKPNSA